MRYRLPLIAYILLAAGCSSIPPAPRLVPTPIPQLPPAQASVMVERSPDFLTRMQAFFSEKPAEPTR